MRSARCYAGPVNAVIDDRFELEAEVGSGGMGTVYRARDRATGERVALKLHAESSALSVERFAREARVLASLSHPRVVRYVAHGVMEGERLYVVMEWVDGQNLHQCLGDRGVTLDESVTVVRDIAEALAHVHRHHILHRDLKPSNVMLVGGRGKLIDFGLARQIHDERKLTRTGVAMGTPGYMAPEQVCGARDLDERTDVFALGCLLYECVTGAPAFFGSNWIAVQTKILLKPPIPPRALGLAVPAALEQLIDGMLVKDPAQRVSTMADVIAALDAVGPLDTRIRQSARGPVLPTRRDAPPWRHPAEPEHLVIATAPEPPALDGLAELVAPLGGTVTQLADGTIVVRIERDGGGADATAARAARCALALRARGPAWTISIVDNRVEHAIDDATRQLAAAELAVLFDRAAAAAIRVDDETAAQLEAEFAIGRDQVGRTLIPE